VSLNNSSNNYNNYQPNELAQQTQKVFYSINGVQNTPDHQFDQLVVYKGRLAKRVNITTEKVRLSARSAYPQPIESKVSGELVGFTVATNSPDMRITCTIFDADGDPDNIVDASIKEVTYLGYGMSYGEAVETISTGLGDVSVDKTGNPHPIKPYVLRYKDTFTDPSTTYLDNEGTPDDRWYVLDYAPVIKEAFSRLFFNITNEHTEQRMIHYLTFRRIDYIQQSESRSPINDPYAIPVDDSVFQVPGEADD